MSVISIFVLSDLREMIHICLKKQREMSALTVFLAANKASGVGILVGFTYVHTPYSMHTVAKVNRSWSCASASINGHSLP